MIVAAEFGYWHDVAALLKEPQFAVSVNDPDKRNYTILRYCAAAGVLEPLQLLLSLPNIVINDDLVSAISFIARLRARCDGNPCVFS